MRGTEKLQVRIWTLKEILECIGMETWWIRERIEKLEKELEEQVQWEEDSLNAVREDQP